MATTITQIRKSASSNQTTVDGVAAQTLLSSSISSSGIGTPYPIIGIDGALITQSGFYLITQSGDNLIIN